MPMPRGQRFVKYEGRDFEEISIQYGDRRFGESETGNIFLEFEGKLAKQLF